jgi:hypothetical protein
MRVLGGGAGPRNVSRNVSVKFQGVGDARGLVEPCVAQQVRSDLGGDVRRRRYPVQARSAGDHSPRAVPSRIGLRRAKAISCASWTPPGSPSATAALAGPHHRPTRPAADARSLTPAAPGGGGIRRAVAVRDELDPSPFRGGVRAPGSAAEPLPRP